MDDVTRARGISAARLKAARLSKRLSLGAAAQAVGVSKSTWQSWEQGSPPNAPDALRVAETLGVTVHHLWGDESSPAAVAP